MSCDVHEVPQLSVNRKSARTDMRNRPVSFMRSCFIDKARTKTLNVDCDRTVAWTVQTQAKTFAVRRM